MLEAKFIELDDGLNVAGNHQKKRENRYGI